MHIATRTGAAKERQVCLTDNENIIVLACSCQTFVTCEPENTQNRASEWDIERTPAMTQETDPWEGPCPLGEWIFRDITYSVLLGSPVHWQVSVTLMLLRVRAEHTQQVLVLLAEDLLCLLVHHTRVLLWAEKLQETGFSGEDCQVLDANVCFIISLACHSLAFQAQTKIWRFLPAEIQTRPAKAVPTVYGDWVNEVLLADETGELLLEDMPDSGIHVSEEEIAGHS